MRKYPFVFGYLPFIAFTTWLLHLPWWAFFVLALAGTSVLACALIVRYFTMEIVSRPVLERLAAGLPPDFTIEAPGLPLRWRLYAAAPIINVVTAVVVAGLSTRGRDHSLSDLGLSWLIAMVISFTVSLELVILVVRAVSSSVADLRRATQRVRAGDFSVRVPIVATDETGRLAQSFNMMVEGLDERERLRKAFGAYVDPGLAERVLREGADLHGEEVEVSVLFLDIRDFTAFAERARPHEVVSLLNGFWEQVVPCCCATAARPTSSSATGCWPCSARPSDCPITPSARCWLPARSRRWCASPTPAGWRLVLASTPARSSLEPSAVGGESSSR